MTNVYTLINQATGNVSTVLVGESPEAIVESLNKAQGASNYSLEDIPGEKLTTLQDNVTYAQYWVLPFEGTSWTIRGKEMSITPHRGWQKLAGT